MQIGSRAKADAVRNLLILVRHIRLGAFGIVQVDKRSESLRDREGCAFGDESTVGNQI